MTLDEAIATLYPAPAEQADFLANPNRAKPFNGQAPDDLIARGRGDEVLAWVKSRLAGLGPPPNELDRNFAPYTDADIVIKTEVTIALEHDAFKRAQARAKLEGLTTEEFSVRAVENVVRQCCEDEQAEPARLGLKTFEFIIRATDLHPEACDVEDRLFKTGCTDATLSFCDDRVVLQFAREAASMEAAMTSAFLAVMDAGCSVIISEDIIDVALKAIDEIRHIKADLREIRQKIDGLPYRS